MFMLLLIFKLLLILIFIFGNLFAYKYFKRNSEEEKESYFNIIAYVYLPLLITCLLTWALSSRNSEIRIVFLISFSLLFILASIFSSLGANIYLNKVEERLNNSRSYIDYVKRIILLATSSLSIAIAISITKSALYKSEITEYDFGKKLNKIIQKNSDLDMEKVNSSKNDLRHFLNDVKLIQDDSIKVLKNNFFSFITGNYHLKPRGSINYKIEYSYTPYFGKGTNPIHIITYTNKEKGTDAFIDYDNIRSSHYEFIQTDNLKRVIEHQIKEFSKIKNQIMTKRAGFIDFSFSSFIDFLGLKNYDIIAKNSKTEIIDLILRWFFWILTTIIFFELVREWNKK